MRHKIFPVHEFNSDNLSIIKPKYYPICNIVLYCRHGNVCQITELIQVIVGENQTIMSTYIRQPDMTRTHYFKCISLVTE